ncbi:protocadherin gamma-A2-like isoform X36 [Eleutherodactylus coqui]|uniref:protocadherin gamma-A2-like isoform X36 n=1 Tax=Eleutherodactylus coqui TaxID=57060 RepID=UPI003462A6DE
MDIFISKLWEWQVLFLLFHCSWVWGSGQLRYSITEESEPGTFVGNVAQDLLLTITDLSTRRMRFGAEKNSRYFALDQDNGDLVVKERLDRESLCGSGAQPNAEWRFSQAQRPGPSGAQPTEEAGVWPNNQFETERLQAMILASANEAAEGTSGLGGGTGTMGLSARYGPQFTLQHVPDYRQNVYIPGSTLTPTNAGGKRDGKVGGNKKKSGKKDKK